ncbi:MAG: radical SAM family heme chaperone HemW [Schaedlerella sp.]|nr:radical SAM family heme chaperone HemW [Schaedlerella sp.]
MKKELELYIHIPFCIRKCAYCDFLSAPSDEKTRDRYIKALIQEIKASKEKYEEYFVSTVFIGGGTPSILTSGQISAVFRAIYQSFEIQKDAEITIEVNPGTASKNKIQTWKKIGINRLSIGLQSVNNDELEMLGRIHSYEQFLDTFHMAREEGFSNINVDLISAIPGQTLESWCKTLRTIAELSPEHISAYSLIIEEGTPFYEKYGEDNCIEESGWLPDEDTERKIYEETENILLEYGYKRYEISNYAKTGYKCKHNCGYWKRTEYIGFGIGAASLIENRRFNVISDLNQYMESKDSVYENVEILSTEEEMEEFMFLGLRMMEGVSKMTFEQSFGKSIEAVYGEVLKNLEKKQLLDISKDRVRLSKHGIDVSNYVFEQFLF